MRAFVAACALLLCAGSWLEAQQPTPKDTLKKAPADTVAADTVAPAPVAQTPARVGSYMNIGFDALLDVGTSTESDVRSLQRGDHDPATRGFTVPNAEISLDGSVDPYFKGFANIVWKLNEEGETDIELEEVYFITTSLPANLQIKAGQFNAEFGRHNTQHPHAWAFVDQPIVLNRLFGPEGLRSQGARVSWLAPTSFYTEFMVALMNSVGGTTWSFRSPESSEIHRGLVADTDVTDAGDMLIVPRFSTSFDLTATQTVLAGVSAVFGPNNSADGARTSIYGADLYYKWKPEAARQGFPFVSLQAEVLFRHYEADERTSIDNPLVELPAETLHDSGWYSQLLWGIRPRIVAGIRVENANGDDAGFDSELRLQRTRVSPSLTMYPSEFSKLRLQYNYDDRENIGTDHSFWIQFEFMIGAHAAHKF